MEKGGAFLQGNLWPNQTQLLAIRAALLSGEDAKKAFSQWLELVNFEEDFDSGTFRVLPLLYDNLRQQGVEHPAMARIKGVYRLSWYRNNKLFAEIAPALKSLDAAGIPLMLLKGIPLIDRYYKNIALRPMADIDVAVPADFAREALKVMSNLPYSQYAPASEDFIKYRHAMQYSSKNHGEIDVHWHLLPEGLNEHFDNYFWSSATPIEFQGIRCVTPDHTRMLFHTLIHGIRWNLEPPIRWICDSAKIIDSAAPEIDWDSLVRFSERYELQYRLGLALRYLRTTLATPVPRDIIQTLDRKRATRVERIENTIVMRDPSHLHDSPLGYLWIVFAQYARYGQTQKFTDFIVGLSHYYRFRLGLRGRSEIFAYIFRGLYKRLARRIRGTKPDETNEPAIDLTP